MYKSQPRISLRKADDSHKPTKHPLRIRARPADNLPVRMDPSIGGGIHQRPSSRKQVLRPCQLKDRNNAPTFFNDYCSRDEAQSVAMNVSEPFIRRPIAT